MTITPTDQSGVEPPRTRYWRLRRRYLDRLGTARAAGASPATLDDLYVSGAAVRNLDPELIRLRRQRWT